MNKTTSHRRIILASCLVSISIGILYLFAVNKTNKLTVSPVRAETRTSPLIVDHTSVRLFDQIPAEYLEQAKNISLLFSNRSVGVNIHSALNCLEWPNNDSSHPQTGEQTPAYCRQWDHHDDRYDVDPGEVNWNVPGGLNRDNWKFGIFAKDWQSMTSEFITALENGQITLSDGNIGNPQNVTHVFNNLDVISFQFSYLNIERGNISDQPGGFVSHNPGSRDDIYDLNATFDRLYPDKTFLYMTTSLARALGTRQGQELNNQIRQFVRDNNRVLLDIADIESYDPSGQPCFDNRDGVQFCSVNNECENYPNDGYNYPALCPQYTTEVDGGHLGSTSGGQIRIVKAFWVLMAQLAGWVPGSTVPQPTATPQQPSPTPTPTISIVTMTPTPTIRLVTPTPTIRPITPTPTSTPTTNQYIHVADLDGYVGGVTQTGYWQAAVRVYVHNAQHQPVAGAIPKVRINNGTTEYACHVRTNSSGFCNIFSPMQPSTVRSVTFRISNIVRNGYTYNALRNHDRDGGTNGTTAVVTR